MTTQLDLFGTVEVKVEKPEPTTTWKVGKRTVQIPLRKKRRQAVARLMELLAQLEGKDIWISSYDAGGRHFWLNNLKLPRLELQYYPFHNQKDESFVPEVIVLWGSKGAQVRIFTDYLVSIREQEYSGYWLYLLDFRNGLWEHPIDNYRSHYACLEIARFKE